MLIMRALIFVYCILLLAKNAIKMQTRWNMCCVVLVKVLLMNVWIVWNVYKENKNSEKTAVQTWPTRVWLLVFFEFGAVTILSLKRLVKLHITSLNALHSIKTMKYNDAKRFKKSVCVWRNQFSIITAWNVWKAVLILD
jgi:hypothetical protein